VQVQVLFVLFGLVIAAFFPYLAPYLRSRGLGPEGIGTVLSLMAVTRIVANPVWGHLADTVLGRRAMLRIGFAGAAAAASLLAVVPDGLLPVAAAAALLGAVATAVGPNLDAIALAHLGQDRAHRYGFVRAWESLSYAAATLAFGLVLDRAGVRWAMPIYAAGCLVVLAWSGVLDRVPPAREEGHGRLGAVGTVLRSGRYRAFLLVSLLLWTGFAAAWNFFALRIQDRDGDLATVGVGLALGGAVEVPVMLASSRLAARFGLRAVYLAGATSYGSGFLLWGLLTDPLLLSLSAALDGLGFGLLFTSEVAIVGRLVRPALHATGLSLVGTVAFGVGQIVGSLLGGLLYARLGSASVYAAASGLAWAATAVAWFVLDHPALRRPRPVAVPATPEAVPPHGPEAG
jgi:PPP family 3-phenylpropionic acid transporter